MVDRQLKFESFTMRFDTYPDERLYRLASKESLNSLDHDDMLSLIREVATRWWLEKINNTKENKYE